MKWIIYSGLIALGLLLIYISLLKIEALVVDNNRKKVSSAFTIQGVEIWRGKTLPTVFDKTGYYVDYANACYTEGVPLISCLVRERATPSHVVGDIGLLDDEDNEDAIPEEVLRTRPVVDGVELNEIIELL